MQGLYAIILLVISNAFMTLAWYGQLKFDWFKGKPLVIIVVASWLIALAEYAFMIPANRIGYQGTGGPFTLLQLKILQEVITLVIFVLFSFIFFKSEPLRFNHLWAALFLILAVYFTFKK